MSRVNKYLPAAVIIALVLILWILPAWRTARESAYASTMSSLMSDAQTGLATYYQRHRRYPSTLEALPADTFKFRDGGDARTLDKFKYSVSADGQKFSLGWEGRWSGTLRGDGSAISSTRNDTN